MLAKVAVALGLATSATAQSAVSSASPPLGSVVSMFLLDTDPQPLVASYIGMANSLTTLAINCPPGTPDDQCGYPQPFTITANPSTVTASAIYNGITLNYGCTLTGTTTGSCSVTYIGKASDIVTEEAAASTATGISTTSTAGSLAAGEITFFPITVTAGSPAAAATPAGSGGAGGAVNPAYPTSAASGTGKTSPNNSGLGGGASPSVNAGSPNGTSGANPVATYSKAGASRIGAPGMLGAFLLGVAALL